MTHAEINQLQAGREMDVLIAEKVMGWRRVPGPLLNGGPRRSPEWQWLNPEGASDFLRTYSTNIADAWQVVEKLSGDWLYLVTDATMDRKCLARFYRLNVSSAQATADTAPLAICRAALKAVMGSADV